MTVAGDRWRIELAGPGEGAELASLYDADDGFPGDIQVRFGRGRDAYASLLAEGDRVVVPVVREAATGRLVGMGALVVRDAWVNGAVRRVGYLTGLKLLGEFRRQVPLFKPVYALLREQAPEVELFYTTILTDNVGARRMLERRRPGMPEYRTVCGYTTHCFRAGGARPGAHRVTRGTMTELRAIGAAGPASNLSPAAVPEGLSDANVWVLRDRRGRPVAGCAVWDQSSRKEYVVTRYGGAYQRVARLPVHWAGYPRLPRVGAPARYASVALLASREAHHLPPLLRGVGWRHRDRDFLMVGLADTHPFAPALRRLRSVTYGSVLYTVHYEADSLTLDDRPIGVEVGLL